ncbi:MAG: hypothetical protein GF315_07035 [candidate division Zixibacteria bacterium]|nr:hypothetical protein [candidate division Zixibacteria bacterium]
MRTNTIFILILIMLIAKMACYAQEEPKSSQYGRNTGDIKVSAIAYGLPPAATKPNMDQPRFKLTLCRMPGVEPVAIPDWVEERPINADSLKIWRNEIQDSLKDNARIVLDYIHDSLGIVSSIGGNKELSIENQYAIAITDSLGNYVFTDIPIGRYQLICEYAGPDTQIVSVWDTLSEHQEDSLKQWLEEIRDDPNKARPVEIGKSTTDKGTHGRSRWIPIVVNYIRVAKDSIALVQTGISLKSSRDILRFLDIVWQPQYKERGKNHEWKKK